MKKRDIRNLTYEELSKYFSLIGEKSFRADQILEWIYQKNTFRFSEMKNLPKVLLDRISSEFVLHKNKIIKKTISSDGTAKILLELKDGEKIETVLIPTEKRGTVCVSTQVGCKFGCQFCASGLNGFKRDLTVAEIIDQIMHMKSLLPGKGVTHIVFMGVGEPLDNYENVLKAVRVINGKKGFGIAARRITISTSGVIPGIKKLSLENLQTELAVSLHGYDEESRNKLMPINKRYNIIDLIKTCREYSRKTKRQITFEYLLIKNITCSDLAAKKLSVLLKGLLCKLNLIPYNKVEEFDYEQTLRSEMIKFKKSLDKLGIHSTLRLPRGRDASAACGQLRIQR